VSELIDPFGPICPQSHALERRISVRYASDEDALCHLGGNHFECSWAKVLDVSQTGIGLILDRALKAGRRLTLEFPEAGSSVRRSLGARVMHCTLQADESWLVGCRFDIPLAEYELRGLAPLAD